MLRFLLDMNLSPELVFVLQKAGYEAVHWSEIGKYDAFDSEIFNYAIENDYIVFTHDLDFGIMLAHTKLSKPSVIQVRTQNIYKNETIKELLAVINKFQNDLKTGALITLDDNKSRVKILPID